MKLFHWQLLFYAIIALIISAVIINNDNLNERRHEFDVAHGIKERQPDRSDDSPVPPEPIEAVARAMRELMGPLFGSPEYLADPINRARSEKQQAAAFVSANHRHHRPPVGHLFSIGAYRSDKLVGVVIVGRPVARRRDDGLTAEVTRLCVLDAEPNACSFLYGKAAKAALAMGYRRIGTYTLKREPGTSLRAAGWTLIGETPG